MNYVEYDSTINGTRKKTFTKTLSAGNNRIVSISSDFDCVLTWVSGSVFDAVVINSTTSTANIISARAVVIADNDDTGIASYASTSIMTGPTCWAFKINNFFYTKNADGSAFVKNTAASAWTGAFYDKSIKYAYVAGQIYKWGTSSFELLFSASGMKSTV